MYTKYQDHETKLLESVKFKRTRKLTDVFQRVETDGLLQQMPESQITNSMLEKSRKILEKDESLLYNI